MMDRILIPLRLYRLWPWLCLAISVGWIAIGEPLVAILMGSYAAFIFFNRASNSLYWRGHR